MCLREAAATDVSCTCALLKLWAVTLRDACVLQASLVVPTTCV
jgi:hypothetical protein